MYLPKNRIITNLYTSSGELVYESTQEIYTGYYWKSYSGEFFTGKNPSDTPTTKLIKLQQIKNSSNTTITSGIATFKLSPNLFFNYISGDYNESIVTDYTKLKNINIPNSSPQNLPTLYFPTPTPSDYKLGVFTRYFVVKINEIRYLEVNDATYQKISNHSLDWGWEAYTPFTLPWTLIGVKEEVYNTNRNIVLLTEQRIKKQGLSQFLKENYTKFWIP